MARSGLMNERFSQGARDDAELFYRDLMGGAGAPVTHEGLAESVIGTDDRFQVRASATFPSTKMFPYNTICLIEDPSAANGSGTLIAPQVVLTAKHCLAGFGPQTITPGADYSSTNAADRTAATPGSQVAPTSGFKLHPTLDIGLAILPRPFTSPTRYMMLQPRGDINTATLLTIAGYPNLGSPPSTGLGWAWAHSNRLQVTDVTPTHLTYTIDTSVGQSGSPLWLLGNDGNRLLLGVHVQGGSVKNTGVRITCAVIDWIEAQCRAASVTGPVVDQVFRRAVCPPPSP
jgi:glutamyl endopeptidase